MIHFEKIRWQNLLSTGNQWTEIQLDKSPTTLIVGVNGSGKSTFLDAISFVLYGKPYREINKPQLVNSITKKNTLAEVYFTIKKKKYKIIRGMQPTIFEIYENGKLIDQNARVYEYQEFLEKNILKLNHKSFCQIVMLGSANFTPFMQLKPAERRKVIEDLLDIQVFSTMFALLKERIARNKDDIQKVKYDIDVLEQKIDLLRKHINEIRSLKKSDKKNKLTKIDNLLTEIDASRNKVSNLLEKIKALNESLNSQKRINKDFEKAKQYLYQLNHNLSLLEKDIDFLHEHDECPTCQQEINEDFKQTKIETKEDKKEELASAIEKLNKKIDQLRAELESISETHDKIADLNRRILTENTNISVNEKSVEELQKEIALSDQIEENDEKVEELSQANKDLKIRNKEHEKLIDLKDTYEIAYSLLKDSGIKSRIIKQYVPVINKLMNKYLASMDFFVQFQLDEQFNEKILSRFRDEFSYNSFSEGEKMRIDLALLFTWRAVAKLRNSAATNILIFDEVLDSSLDPTGTEEFIRIINHVLTDTNVFIISHKKDELFDKFHEVLIFEKVKNFSQIIL